MQTYIGVYFGSTLLALVITPAVIRLARRTGAVDHPGVRSVHEQPTPRIGGVAIFISSMCLILSALYLRNDIGEAFREVRLQVTTLLFSATLIFLVGLVDDLKGLPARFKFLAEVIAAEALCLAGIRIDAVGVTSDFVIHLGWLGSLLTLLWVVGITNAVNLSDGLDGLAAGISAIACGVIAILAIHGGNVVMAVFALALVGSLSGFLVFNFNPAKIFMGDCGSLFLGFTIAASSVLCMTKSSALVGLALPALALGIPIFDTLFSMLRRFLERRSLFAPDRSHFHHRLLDLGFHQRHAVMIIYLLTSLLTGLGLFMMISRDIHSVIVLACVLLLLLVSFRVVGAVRLGETLARLQKRHKLVQRERLQRAAFENAQLLFQQVRDVRQWWQAVCEAADRMDFAWVSLTTTARDGRVETNLWRAPGPPPEVSRILLMTVPLGTGREGIRQEFEIAVCCDGSLEDACRRASFFGRLIDAHRVVPMTADTESHASSKAVRGLREAWEPT